ncbi:MAG: (Fe-S)-binding protein [Nitrosomonas sp.]|nr:(Fe-S)-binding protein [Nitrosomonas sp.]
MLEETTRCVSCGLCLPHCPTYRLLKSEADSPRGRIAIMNGVANDYIPLNKKFLQHLDRCLTCRACESVCPNNVAYGQLIDEARKMVQSSSACQNKDNSTAQKQQPVLKLLERFAVQPMWLDRLRWLAYLSQKSGLLRQLQSFQWLKKRNFWKRFGMERLLTQLRPVVFPYSGSQRKNSFLQTWRTFYPAVGEEKGKVGLFLGCVARLTDAAALNAGIFVLNRLGYGVCIPADQVCCGALHQHAGDAEKAAQLKRVNMRAFGKSDLLAVVSLASGCCVQLTEYDLTVPGNNPDNSKRETFPQVMDISKFLVAAEGWDSVHILPLAAKIAIHDPCSLRHVLGDQDYPYQLLRYIPDAQVVDLADNDQCCGAAGTYFIRQPELAERLLDDKIGAINQSGAQLLVTSNVGCAMHMAGRLQEIGTDIEVLHPVVLLARQMGT